MNWIFPIALCNHCPGAPTAKAGVRHPGCFSGRESKQEETQQFAVVDSNGRVSTAALLRSRDSSFQPCKEQLQHCWRQLRSDSNTESKRRIRCTVVRVGRSSGSLRSLITQSSHCCCCCSCHLSNSTCNCSRSIDRRCKSGHGCPCFSNGEAFRVGGLFCSKHCCCCCCSVVG